MRLICRRALGLALQLMPLAAAAWTGPGHQQVGAIADRLLAGSPAQAQVQRILAGRSLQEVAVWADCVKAVSSADDRHFAYTAGSRYPECRSFENAEDEARMVDYAARNWKQCGSAKGPEHCHNQYHYADIANLRDRYEASETGASDHDIVHAINAAVAVLQDRQAPAPFGIRDKREALTLLAHFVGDIHQPLHVGAVYLDALGQVVDPDRGGYDAATDTAGGNRILDHGHSLHLEWDAIAPEFQVDGERSAEMLALARRVPRTRGDLSQWASGWADEALALEHDGVFEGLRFRGLSDRAGAKGRQWSVSGVTRRYEVHADRIKMQQISKAGARLAQLLAAIWP